VGDLRRLKRLTRYLLGTKDVVLALIPERKKPRLVAPVDSDWADSKLTRKSCSGGALLLHGSNVSSWARTQTSYAQSSAEGELYALGTGGTEAIGLSHLLEEFGYETTPLLLTDSKAAQAISGKRGPGRAKHIELKELAIQDWLERGMVKIGRVCSEENPSDLMTKAVDLPRQIRFGRKLGLRGGPFQRQEYDRGPLPTS